MMWWCWFGSPFDNVSGVGVGDKNVKLSPCGSVSCVQLETAFENDGGGWVSAVDDIVVVIWVAI